ncbi:hypothetical protein SAMN06265339_1405 [Desulfurobacterium pacificum]|uniref:DUF304 domain-containing protein n=1 Tax=Desulfurobacterium pacificum TaxID=240166 RepID=A0ABY1NR08_9BACT|nr:hypothetical protein [Desulfurobacterium pacificum]SMP15658.1 hypothetical protein SAMN06265339_1405 [Desulfurobacterium pacificum]
MKGLKEFRVKQDPLFIGLPLFVDLVLLILALFLPGIWKVIGVVLALGFAGYVLWQSRPILKNYELVLTPKEVIVKDFRGNVVRRVEWKKVEAAAAGVKKTWKMLTYSFFFRVRGDEDIMFALVTREEGLTGKFQSFMKVTPRKKVPVQIVKA